MTAVGDSYEETAVPAIEYGLPVAAFAAAVGVALSGASSATVWYVIRASGIVAYLVLAVSVAGGLLISNRSLPSGRPRVDLFEAHTFLSLLALSFAGFHALALLLDQYIGFSPRQILIPLTSDYRPVAVALGIMAFYLGAIVYGSAWARRRIGYKAWRTLHYATFAVFALSTGHGVLSGADTGQTWMIATYLASAATVVALVIVRLVRAAEAAERLEASVRTQVSTPIVSVPESERQVVPLDDSIWRRPTGLPPRIL